MTTTEITIICVIAILCLSDFILHRTLGKTKAFDRFTTWAAGKIDDFVYGKDRNHYIGFDLASQPDETAWICSTCGTHNHVKSGESLECKNCGFNLKRYDDDQ